jgi:hypothetical protein
LDFQPGDPVLNHLPLIPHRHAAIVRVINAVDVIINIK